MLERVWRKGNPLTMLVGMQTSTATVENQCGDSLKTENRTAVQPSNPTAGLIHQKKKKELKETRVPQCSSQHCLQYLGHGSNLDVHQQMNG